jgi:hypothetical protein
MGVKKQSCVFNFYYMILAVLPVFYSWFLAAPADIPTGALKNCCISAV